MMERALFERRVRELAAEATVSPAPADAWSRIAARLSAGDAVLLPLAAAPARRRPPLTRVVALIAVVSSAALAAVPGSPVRQWIGSQLAARGEREPGPVESGTPPAVAAVEARTTFFVEPVNGSVVLSVISPTPGARIIARVVEGAEVELVAEGLAAASEFRASAGRLTVTGVAGGTLTLALPGAVPHVRVEVDGQLYLEKRGSAITVRAPAADTAGTEIVMPIGRRQ